MIRLVAAALWALLSFTGSAMADNDLSFDLGLEFETEESFFTNH